MPITALYAAIAAIMFCVLAFRTIAIRRETRVALGAGDSDLLLQRIRAHGNFAEYAPPILILLALSESLSAPALLLHAIGIVFITGRIIHAWAIATSSIPRRVTAMMMTFTALAAGALTCLVLAASSLAAGT